jgi:cytidylate kinase
MKINIAIDGYSSCGKSTLAKFLSQKLEYSYIDTGAMYRSVTLYLVNRGLIKDGKVDRNSIVSALPNIDVTFKYNASKNQSDTYLNGENVEDEIRSPEISGLVSGISTLREVRQKLIALQKKMGEGKGIVMDGRDIGTAVLPNAEVKFFVTADLDVRSQRRFDELESKGYSYSFDKVKKNLLERDHNDTHREENPLRQAEDAILLDNTELSIDELVNMAFDIVMKKQNSSLIQEGNE